MHVFESCCLFNIETTLLAATPFFLFINENNLPLNHLFVVYIKYDIQLPTKIVINNSYDNPIVGYFDVDIVFNGNNCTYLPLLLLSSNYFSLIVHLSRILYDQYHNCFQRCKYRKIPHNY